MTDSLLKDHRDPARSKAVALRYESALGVPAVLARGEGLLADQIVEEAQRHGIALTESPALATALVRCELDEAIPPEFYRVVAEILAWVWTLEHPAD
jgi:flagellar biosynthesis protein